MVALQTVTPPTVEAAADLAAPGPGGRYLVEFEAGSDPYLDRGSSRPSVSMSWRCTRKSSMELPWPSRPTSSTSCEVSHSSRTLKLIRCSASTASNHHLCNRRPCRPEHRGVSIVSISARCRCRPPTATTAREPGSRHTSSTRGSPRCTPTSAVGSVAVSRRSLTGSGRAIATGTARMLRALSAGRPRALPRASRWLRCAVLDCTGSTTVSQMLIALDWVIADHQAGVPAVANISIGGPASSSLDAGVQALITDGVTVAVAAGNETLDACTRSPAQLPAALTVAASTETDARPVVLQLRVVR